MSDQGSLEQPHLHFKAPYRAPSLFYPANFRRAMQEVWDDPSEAFFGVAQVIPSVALTETFASIKPSHIWFDAEHAITIHATQAMSEGATMAIARVPKQDETLLSVALDAGASAIIIPHTESAAQVKAMAQKTHYPPKGHWSISPWISMPGVVFPLPHSGDSFCKRLSNDHIGVITQVESVQRLQNVEEIAAYEYTTALIFGPGDYAGDAGLPMDWSHSGIKDALARVCAASKKYGEPIFGPSSTTEPEQVPALLDMGYRALNSIRDLIDITLLVNGKLQESRGQARKCRQQAQGDGSS